MGYDNERRKGDHRHLEGRERRYRFTNVETLVHDFLADAALKEMGARFVKTWKAGKSAGDTLQFESPAALFRVLTPKRWELVELLQKLEPSSLRGLARELERDVKRVHEDVSGLMECGLIARTEERKLHVLYDVIHADFDLRAVA